MSLKNKLAIIIACGMLVACASNAPTETGTNTKDPSPSVAALEKRGIAAEDREICKVRAITGSRFKQKTCMTAAEWEKMSHESKSMVDSATRRGVMGNPDEGL